MNSNTSPMPSEALAVSFPPIVNAVNFLAEDIQDEPEVFYGIFTKRAKAVVSAGSKARKTWFLTDASVSVSTGEPCLSIKTTKGPVLYVNLELKKRTYQKRLDQVCAAKNIKRTDLANLDIWHLRGHPCSWDILFPKIKEAAKNRGYLLIVVDPIYKVYGGLKENAAEDMATLTNEFGVLAEETGAAILIAAHHTKGNQSGKNAIDRISGSGVIARDADALIDFTENETENAFTVSMTLREFKPVAPFVVRWDCPIFRRDDSLNPHDLKRPNGKESKYKPEMLLEVLGDSSLGATEWQRRTREETGMSSGTFYQLLPTLKQSKQVVQDKKDRFSRVTPVTPVTPN